MTILPKIKLKTVPMFPARVSVSPPLVLDQSNGNFAFSLDTDALEAMFDARYARQSSGLWTPAPTFAVPGTVNFSAPALGWWEKVGLTVIAHFAITSTLTLGTASGNFQIHGLPFNVGSPAGSNAMRSGGIQWQGITKAGFTDMVPAAEPVTPPAVSFITIRASGSAQTAVALTAADFVNGALNIRGASIYTAVE